MIVKVPIKKLIFHEVIIEKEVRKILKEMKKDGFLLRPVAVSRIKKPRNQIYYLVHDGHHRVEALRRLGCQFVMANLIDFWADNIKVFHYYDLKKEFPKKEVIELALRGKGFRPKTTKHFILSQGKLTPFHNSEVVEPKIFVPIKDLY